ERYASSRHPLHSDVGQYEPGGETPLSHSASLATAAAASESQSSVCRPGGSRVSESPHALLSCSCVKPLAKARSAPLKMTSSKSAAAKAACLKSARVKFVR